MRRLVGLMLAGLVLGAAAPAAACAVSHPLPPEVLAERAEQEGQAWASASMVYLARLEAFDPNGASYRLAPVRVLKGRGRPQTFDAPPEPVQGMCLIYHGLNVEHGAVGGDLFIVYVLDDAPVAQSQRMIVSRRMVGDPATLRALRRRGL